MINLILKPLNPITALEDGMTFNIPAQGGDINIENLPDLPDMRYLVLDITTYSDMHLPITIKFFKENREEPEMVMTTSSVPTVRAVMPLDLQWLDNRNVFKARTPGRMKTIVFGTALAASEVSSIRFHVHKFHQDTKIVMHNVYLSKEMPCTDLIDPKPVVDEFGQVSIRDWPDKTKCPKEMTDRLQSLYEKASAAKEQGMPYPEIFAYSKWGGDSSKRLTQGTGYFAVHRDGDVWYLTDPDGYAFFSVGPDCVGTNTASMLSGIESLYASLPDRQEYKEAYSRVTDFLSGDEVEFIDFNKVNMIRTFGDKWHDAYSLITEFQLKEMGFNTIANWSDSSVIRKTSMPYVLPLNGFPSTKQLIFRDFPDVYSDEYNERSVSYAEQLKAYANDRRLIGYFMRNEPQWGFSDDIILAREMFREKTPFESKRKLWEFLLEKYGSANDLSKAWGKEIKCEQCFMNLSLGELPETEACTGDLRAFSHMMVEQYVAIPAKALRAVDPNHLNMGMRYAYITSDTMYMGSDYLDVFSINCYKNKPSEGDLEKIMAKTGKPCIIGEYHHGANDRGCFGNSLRGVASTAERGVAYQYYTEQGAAMASLLGCHYFSYSDEAALGRFDGECWIMGFVDVCHRPYKEMYDAAIRTHRRIYKVRAMQEKPYDTPPMEALSNCY